MLRKGMRILLAFVGIILLIYLIMLLDTNPVISQVEKVFRQEIDPDTIVDSPLSSYSNSHSDLSDAEIKLSIRRNFVWHNFKEGYMWIYYTFEARTQSGELITGSWGIPAKWEIRKIDGEWQVVKIWENP